MFRRCSHGEVGSVSSLGESGWAVTVGQGRTADTAQRLQERGRQRPHVSICTVGNLTLGAQTTMENV